MLLTVLVLALVAPGGAVHAAPVMNGGFGNSLTGWRTMGNVTIADGMNRLTAPTRLSTDSDYLVKMSVSTSDYAGSAINEFAGTLQTIELAPARGSDLRQQDLSIHSGDYVDFNFGWEPQDARPDVSQVVFVFLTNVSDDPSPGDDALVSVGLSVPNVRDDNQLFSYRLPDYGEEEGRMSSILGLMEVPVDGIQLAEGISLRLDDVGEGVDMNLPIGPSKGEDSFTYSPPEYVPEPSLVGLLASFGLSTLAVLKRREAGEA